MLKLVALADADGESFAPAIGLGLQAVLVSPHFLFRVELDPEPNDPRQVRTLNDYELATRLSYFLWSSMPDDELFAHARQGTLRKAQPRRAGRAACWRDPKAQALVENFAGQWLQLRNLKIAAPDKAVFPSFDEPLRAAMQKETELFFDDDRPRGPQRARLPRRRLHVRQRAAGQALRHRRTSKGDEFRRVKLDPSQRGGVLTQASVLTVTSNPTRTSPVKRGKWVLENILGTPPPPPPPDVPPLNEDSAAAERASLRAADGAAPRQRRAARSATPAWTRSASASRTSTPSAPGGPRTASSRSTRRARCPDGRSFAGPARAEGHPQGPAGRCSPAAWPRRC